MRKLLHILCRWHKPSRLVPPVVMGLWAISLCHVWGQHMGTVGGRVLDRAGEAVIGANVWVIEAEQGAAANLEGEFVIADVAAGTYTVRISAVSFETKVINQVSIHAGEHTRLDITLLAEDIVLKEVHVQAERVRDNEASLLDLQRKSTRLFEGLSARQISRTGDNQVASAVRRMTGVTVEGGKYVYVRGLGDRYSLTYLNGAYIPGLDPNRNSAQLDMFPTSLINNLTIHKAFNADLPGDFAGGYLDIETKDIPDGAILSFGTSLGYTTGVHFQDDYLTYTGGRLDWLGFDDGTRTRPRVQRQIPVASLAQASAENSLLQEPPSYTHENTEMTANEQSAPLNQRYAFSIGNRHTVLKRPFGYMLALSYQRDGDSYRNGVSRQHGRTGPQDLGLIPALSLNDARSSDNVLWGALLNLGYRFHDKHRLTMTLMHNQKGEKTVRQQNGDKPADDNELRYLTSGLWYTERGISSVQLKGQHTFSGFRPLQVDWISSASRATISQPDLRFFTYGYRESAEEDPGQARTYKVEPSIGQIPTRYFRDMNENLWDTRLHFRKPFLSWVGREAAVKMGAAYSWKERHFREDQYRYNASTGAAEVPNGSPEEYIARENVSLVGATIAANNYDARQDVWAGYGLLEWPLLPKLHMLTGLRYEGTSLSLRSFDDTKKEGELLLHDMLPSLSFTYRLRKDLNIKAAYGRTIARPTFRELAPFGSFDFIGDYLLVGNPRLQRTRIDNFDLRTAWYPAAGEILSASVFYKHFDKPIERTLNIEASGTELTYRNVNRAQIAGIEFNVRKGLGFLYDPLEAFTLGTNFTYAYSWVDIDGDELLLRRLYDSDAPSTRPMFGQSPYVVNAFLGYESKRQWMVNMSYNIFGRRIAVVTSADNGPDIYEQSRHVLNMNVSKTWKRWKFRVSVNNMLNAEYRFTQTFRERAYFFQTYRVGQDISIGATYTFEK